MAYAPSATPQPAEPPPSRRGFFQWLTYGLGAVAGVVVGVPFLGFLLGTRKPKPEWVKLGAVSDYTSKPGETLMKIFPNPLQEEWDGITAKTGVYVRYEGKGKDNEDQFLVLAVNCAHLGCPVSWFPQSGLFMCPCHGGVYYANGQRASGPPPRGLFRCNWRVVDGRLEVQAPHYPTLQDPLDPNDKEAHG